MRAWRALAALLACAGAAAHAQSDSGPEQATRPRIALVLSGGGARGFAHIGVLRVLRELKVPVDLVVGTSMGSVVGGAYAAGASVETLEHIVRSTDWDSVVADRPARDELAFRRREEDLLLPSRIEFGVTARGITLPPAAAGNAALELALERLLPAGMRDRPVNQLPLPFRSVASDLVTGELVELVDTPLFVAMRASLSVPGVFSPLRWNQRLLVDGGLVRNLPIDLARAMGAQVVIAVNVGTPLAPESQLGSAIGVAQQMLHILTEQNVKRSLKELEAQDILIAPDLSGVSFLDFHAHERAMQIGAQAARLLAPRLQALALSAQRHAGAERQRQGVAQAAETALPLTRLQVRGTQAIAPQVLRVESGLREGEPVRSSDMLAATRKLYGRGDLERVEIESTVQDGQREVSINVTEAEWARSRLRVGLELASDFADGNAFNIGLLHVVASLNDWGAELRTVARVGTLRQLGLQWWQPLGPGSTWYLAPSVQYGGSAADLFSAGRKQLRVDLKSAGVTLVLGHQLGDWGDVQVGATRQTARLHALIPDDDTHAPVRVFDSSQFVQLRMDTLDSLAFPRRGQLLTAVWERSLGNQQGTASLARSQTSGLVAFGAEEWAGHFYGEWARAQQGFAPLTLGGFLRLSGTTANSIEGREVLLTRLVLAHRLGAMPLPLGGLVRAGFSLELGAGSGAEASVGAGALKRSASAFVSVDTRFGPLYFGAGATQRSGASLYLFLGPIWQ